MKSELSIRKPAVAGMFYPSDPEKLRLQVRELVLKEKPNIKTGLGPNEIIGGVVPHAGYIYSGYEAVHFFELVQLSGKKFDTIIILNPDHQGYSPEYATTPHNFWETPLGTVEIDRDLATFFPQSELAHLKEHSAEVMLPFIQVILDKETKILPISIGNPIPETAKILAHKIFNAAQKTKHKVLIVASSDFSHYVTPEDGIKLDDIALERIFAKDSKGFFQAIKNYGISICGYGPIMTLIEYSLLCCKSPCTLR